MGKFWDRDPRDLTVLEYIHGPISQTTINPRRYNKPRAYEYYDTPDGQDFPKKLWVATKWGAGTGSFLGLMDVMLFSNPRTLYQKFNRFAYFVVPFTSMFATYAAISYITVNIKGPDNVLNCFLGGLGAGCIAGVWQKSGHVGLELGLVAGIVCVMAKAVHKHGEPAFNPRTLSKMYGLSSNLHNRDLSFTPIGNRGWTTGAE